jgi:hypothetical protein
VNTILNRAVNLTCLLIIGLTAFAFVTSETREPVVLLPEQSAAGTMAPWPAPTPSVALLTDPECLGYTSADYFLVVAYIAIKPLPRAVYFEYSGVGSSVNELPHDLGRGYRLVPIRHDGQMGRAFIRVQQTHDEPIRDYDQKPLYDFRIDRLVSVTASSMGLRCDGTKAVKRRTVGR